MPAKPAPLYNAQVDALEQLAKSDLVHGAPGWIVREHPSMPLIRPQTVRSLSARSLCRINWHNDLETARITQAGRKALSEILAARSRVRSVA
jgi:hypothetical protein